MVRWSGDSQVKVSDKSLTLVDSKLVTTFNHVNLNK